MKIRVCVRRYAERIAVEVFSREANAWGLLDYNLTRFRMTAGRAKTYVNKLAANHEIIYLASDLEGVKA